ncbi:MAG: molybdopterin molybdenumtransferase MoeA, partial [Deltaproteobacteria bacterium]
MTKRFLDLIPSERAYELIAGFAPLEVERLDPRKACGRVLAEDVTAPEDVPHFDRSNMDGYAVRAEDTAGASEHSAVLLRLAGSVAMGTEATVAVSAGTAVQVSTGAMLPPGADAVVMVEDTEEEGADMIAVRRPVVSGENLIRAGEDVRRGAVVATRGKRLGGSDVGALMGLGVTEVAVHRSP